MTSSDAAQPLGNGQHEAVSAPNIHFLGRSSSGDEACWRQQESSSPEETNSARFFQARGAILGALIGDAAGATLEFLGRAPSLDEVDLAMAMSGGGVWNTAPGQVTDDGEMTLALCHALAGAVEYPWNQVARAYRRWHLSAPFDIGCATDAALGEGDLNSQRLARIVSSNALEHNSESKANGSLMRSSPLGVWSLRCDLNTAIEAARTDARLTHPNVSCQWSTAAYVVAIRHLMLHPGDHLGAFALAESIVPATEGGEVLGWLNDARESVLPACHPRAGFVRIAFTHAFHHLHQATPYADALRMVLALGGDTDTNACIIGGLIGALWGDSGLPNEMSSAVLQCDCAENQPRPDWLQTRYLNRWIEELLT